MVQGLEDWSFPSIFLWAYEILDTAFAYKIRPPQHNDLAQVVCTSTSKDKAYKSLLDYNGLTFIDEFMTQPAEIDLIYLFTLLYLTCT